MDNLPVIAICITVIGWPITAYVAYRFGLRSKKMERQWAMEDAKKKRRADFLSVIDALRNTIQTSGGDPTEWVNFFKDNIVGILAAYSKTAIELEGEEKTHIDDAMRVFRAIGTMSHGDIYERQQELFDAINRIPEN